MLRDTHIRFAWLNCPSEADYLLCTAPEQPTDLEVRIVRTALPQATVNTLGMASRSESGSTALIFYDRVKARSAGPVPSYEIFGKVMAHEIAHQLLPFDSHEKIGLMRAKWDPQDLSLTSQRCLGLSAESVRLMQRETLRRMSAVNATLARTQVPANKEPDLNGEPE